MILHFLCQLCQQAANLIKKLNVIVVDMPCQRLLTTINKRIRKEFTFSRQKKCKLQI